MMIIRLFIVAARIKDDERHRHSRE